MRRHEKPRRDFRFSNLIQMKQGDCLLGPTWQLRSSLFFFALKVRQFTVNKNCWSVKFQFERSSLCHHEPPSVIGWRTLLSSVDTWQHAPWSFISSDVCINLGVMKWMPGESCMKEAQFLLRSRFGSVVQMCLAILLASRMITTFHSVSRWVLLLRPLY